MQGFFGNIFLFEVFGVDNVGKTGVLFHFGNCVVAPYTTTFFIDEKIVIIKGNNEAVANVALIIYMLDPNASVKDFLDCLVHNVSLKDPGGIAWGMG